MRFPGHLAALAAACAMAVDAHASKTCAEFRARLPNVSLALCNAAQLEPSAARSVHGRPIYMRDIRPDSARLRVLVIGGMHGDELSSSAVALHWIRLAQNTTDPIHWRFVPALNPDGLFDKPARRVNANGVDLNRNFPTPNWQHDAAHYWEIRTRRDPRRWPGKAPLSEPESRFLHDELQRFRPNLIVSIHAPYGLLDFDGSVPPPSRLGRLHLNQVGIFPGSLGHYGGIHRGTPVVTVELPNALLTPRNVEIERMWRDLLQWMGGTLAQNESTDTADPLRR